MRQLIMSEFVWSSSDSPCKAWFKRRILHAPNQILILVDSNEYVRLIWFKHRIVLPNKIAEREWRVLNSHSSKHKLFNIISIQFGRCKMRRLNQLSKFSRIFGWTSRIFDWLASNWTMSHLKAHFHPRSFARRDHFSYMKNTPFSLKLWSRFCIFFNLPN